MPDSLRTIWAAVQMDRPAGSLQGAGDEGKATEEEAEALRQRQEKRREARQLLEGRLAAKGQELSEQKNEELKKKINLTDLDARTMELVHGESNPAYP